MLPKTLGLAPIVNRALTANLFNVDANGNVTSLGTITKGNYNFNVVYTASNGPIHTEQVVLNLTEALQGSTISAHSLNQITITSNVMSSINGFAARDGFGHYRIGVNRALTIINWTINRDSGTITSVGNIEYDTQSSFTFDVIYDGSDGRKIYRDSHIKHWGYIKLFSHIIS